MTLHLPVDGKRCFWSYLREVFKLIKHAIIFNLDSGLLSSCYPGSDPISAYSVLKTYLEKHNFVRLQGNLYLGDDTVDAVKTVLVAQKLSNKFPWFKASVQNMRMLRIEDDNDLMPIFQNK